MKPTKIYTFIVPAGGALPLLVQGDYFKVMAQTGPLEIRGDTFGQLSPILTGQGMRDTPFGRLEVKDLTGVPNQVSLLVADAAFVDDRISGEVSVIDGAKARAITGVAFMATPYTGPAIGNKSAAQLWNPVGSGRRLIVDQVRAASNTAQGLLAAFTTAPLANDYTAQRIASRLSGGPASVALARGAPAASIGGAPYLLNFTVATSLTEIFVPKGAPLVIEPGYGLTVENTVDNTSVTAVFEYFEESKL